MTLPVNQTLRVSSSSPAENGWCCVQSGSLPPLVEAGSRQGNTAMETEDTTDPVPDPLFVPMAGAMASGLKSLDIVDLVHVLEVKAMVMRSIPKFMRGVFGGAMKVGLHEITNGGRRTMFRGRIGMEIVHAPPQTSSLQTVARGV